MQAELLVLRLVHVLGGIFWVGSALFTSLFLLPALGQSGPMAAQVMSGLQRRRLFLALPLVALLTIGSGVRLTWLTSGGFSEAYFATPNGQTYALSALASIVAFLLSLLVSRPASVRMGGLAASLARAADADKSERERLEGELRLLRRRTGIASAAAVILLVAAAAGMAIARYL